MNRIYRLVWSETNRAFVPAAETVRRRGKRSGGGRSIVGGLVASALSTVALGAGSVGSAGSAVAPNALPTAPQVTVGHASVSSKGSQMEVTETTSNAAINWGTFNIGSAAGVTFVQPTSTSVVLNRVLSADPSQIYGSLKANGIIFLINAQGIVVGQGAEVNVGGLVASSLNISDKDFAAGNWSFTGSAATGMVSNAGAIHVTPGGFTALLGSKVTNTGSIDAKLGTVALASGNQVTLDLDNSGLLKVAINQAAVDALVQNSGAVLADGGRIILTAKSANDVLGTVVNNTGVLQAQSVGMHDGQVWLLAADPIANTGANGAGANSGAVREAAGAVVSSGSIDVSGNGAASAGEATLAGTTVALAGSIDASNATGSAGRVLLNSTGSTTLAASSNVNVSSAATGGKLVAWSDGATSAQGTVDGSGVGAAGTGAMVEISSAHGLGFDATVKLGAAAAANAGTLILDPATLEIAPGSGSAIDTVYQTALQTQAGNVVLSATGLITVDALTNNVLNLANATSLSITSQNTGGITFLNGAGGTPSGITTHNAPVTLIAAGSGSIDNVGQITTNGGDIALSGVYVHLAGGLDATNGANAPGNVALSVFGGGILSSSASPIAGGQVLLDATYGYIGTAAAAVPTATSDLLVKTGGNAYITNTGSLTTLALTSNHLEGTPVGIDITAANLVLTGADAVGDDTMYSDAVRWTNYSAANPGSLAAPTTVAITEDGNLMPANINLPQTALTLTSNQGYILGGNAQPVIASTLTLASSVGIGGTDFNGINAENDQGAPGNTLATQAGTITANVLNPSASITGIVNITQQGDMVGSAQASSALLQATGSVGSSAQPFLLNTGNGGTVFNVAAAGDVYLTTQFMGNVGVTNAQAGGNLTLLMTPTDYSAVYINQALAGGNVTLTSVSAGDMQVNSATSTNGSIAITNDYSLEVFAATLNGTDAANRFIDLTSNYSNVVFGLISTNGPTGAAAASAPLGSININAPQGSIEDLAYWEDPPPSVLRAANATLTALYDIDLYNTGVDTYTNLTMTAGAPGTYTGSIYASLSGIDSVNDPNGYTAHSIHVAGASAYYGEVNISNSNGDLAIGNVRAYYDYGGGSSDAGYIYLTASGSIVADGSVGGGRIDASNLGGSGGYISLDAEGGNLGTRGTGAGGTLGASYLSLSGNQFQLYSAGDLFANNDQGAISYLDLYLNYASSTSPFLYHFTSQSQSNPAAITFNAASSSGLLTVNSATTADGSGNVYLYGDGDIEVQSWQVGASNQLGIYGQNITIDASSNATPALAMGDSSWLQIQANGSLTIGNMASTGTSPGDSTVDLEAYGGNLTLGVVSAANANVTVYANNGDILGSAGNQVLANNLSLSNSFGAIGADPTVVGSIPITLGVAQNLTITNEGGGGSINLVTLNDPTSLNLTLNTPNPGSYAGAHFSMSPATTGLGFSGSAVDGAVTLTSLGTTGVSATAVPVVITADTPSITINSGTGPQLGIGYDLYFGGSYKDFVVNLAGSGGQNVNVHLDNTGPVFDSLTGTIALTNLVVDENLGSGHDPVSVNLTLGQPLNVFTLNRTGSDSDPTSFTGNSMSLAGSGQSFTAVETTGTAGSAPGVMTVNAASTTALDLNVNLQTAGIIDVGSLNFGALGSVNLLTNVTSAPFSGVLSAIEGASGSNSISAGTVNLSAIGQYAGQATIGTSTIAVNVNAPNVALTSSGDIYLTTGGTLSSLAVNVSHPYRDTNGAFNTTSENYVYSIGGSTSLTATDDATDTATALSFTSGTPVSFTFTSDRIIDVGTISAGVTGSVTLNANGTWANYPYYLNTAIGIEQVTGSGITAGTVTLNSNGFEGHAGTPTTPLNVATGTLNVNVNGNMNIADSLALDVVSLTLSHGAGFETGNRYANSYALTAPNIALTLVDQFNNYWNYVQVQNLVSSTLQTFTLNTDANLTLGAYNGETSDFTGNRIALGSAATLNLISTGSIWGQPGGGTYTLSDAATTAVADTAAVIQVGTLNLHSSGDAIFSPQSGIPLGAGVSIPVEVTNLNVVAGGEVAITNVGDLDVVSAAVTGSAYFRAVESTPGVAASLIGGSLAMPLTAGTLQLVAYYGDIGSNLAPAITNTSNLVLDSGADIYAANQSQLAALTIDSNHNKGSIGDTSYGGLNTILVTDTGAQGSAPLQLGITDLGALGGGYQITGLSSPELGFSFETDDGISVGSVTAASVALTSDTASILHIAGPGTITAGAVSLTAATTGQSVGAVGDDILVATPSLALNTGGNMVVADSSNIANLSLIINAVTNLGSTPAYQLDNSAAPNPLIFNVTADTVNNVLDINTIAVSRTDVPVAISIYSAASGIGVNTISDDAVAGGSVSLDSNSSLNVFGLGVNPAGISASTVSLTAQYGNIGSDFSGVAAPVVVTTDTLTALSSGGMQLSSPATIANLTLQEWNSNPTGAVWNIATSDFALHGTYTNASVLDITSVTGLATNLEVDTATPLTVGSLALGSGNLVLSAVFNNNYHSIESDNSNGATANIATSGNVTLDANTGIGDIAQITTDIGGNLALSNAVNAINVAQISSTPLTISELNQCWYCGTSPITISALGSLTFTANVNGGTGATVLSAGGDINYTGVALVMNNGGTLSLSAGGSINGGDVWQASTVSMTAAGTATGSPGTITVGNVDGQWYNPASGAITLNAVGDINIFGQVISSDSVSITSSAGGIYGQANNTFSLTPSLTLTAANDIGSGGPGSVSQWQLNYMFSDDPGTLTLSAQAGGQINVASYAALDAVHVVGGGNVALQTFGDYQGSSAVGISVGQISSASGSVSLTTDNGDITASGAGSAISAAAAINLTALQNQYYFSSGSPVVQAFNLGSSGEPLSLTAPQVSLTANGDIYATVPTTGLTDLSVARTYVTYNSNLAGNQTLEMPAGTVLIKDPDSDTVLSVADGGWASGNVSAVSASYGSALNLSYAGNNAIQLDTLSLDGGNLNVQATSPSNISISSTGGLIQANNFSFNLVDANGMDGTDGTASGGFGTLAHPINTEITSLSGTTVGPTAGVFMNQIGAITFANLATGGDIVVTTTRVTGALTANADIDIGNVTSGGGSVSLTADGAIVSATGVANPSITANGPSGDADVTLSAAAGINLPGIGLSSNSGNLNISASAGGVTMTTANLNAPNGNISILATAGGIEMASSNVNANNGNTTIHAVEGDIDLTAAGLQSYSGSSVTTLTADAGDITLGSIYTSGTVAVTATTGAIYATSPSQNLTGLINGIAADSSITLSAATGIGTAVLPVSVTGGNNNVVTTNTSGNGANVYLVTGVQDTGSTVELDGTIGGSLSVANFFTGITLDTVQTAGDINVTQQNYYSQIVLNNVTATGPGATFTFVAPYGDVSSENTGGVVSASRIVLNALGDPSGGTLGQNYSPVNVDADVVIAVASNNISLNSVASGATKMPLVASNGETPTVSITSAGDFLVGQVVAGQQGTVNITSGGNIFDDGDITTQIYAGAVNLTAVNAIGTALTPVSTTAIAYDKGGNVIPGTITAASTTSGNLYLTQTGDATLQSLTAANGSINVVINDPVHGQSQLVYADTTATDAAGNDINVVISGGDLTVDVAQAGMTAGTVNLTATAGSLYGDGRADCCTNPNVSGNTVNLAAENNIGAITSLSQFTGTALGVEANETNATTSANSSQIYIQYVGNATVGGASPNSVTPLGTSTEVLLAACGNLTLLGLNLPNASVGLLAGTGGNGGSVLDGINGGSSLANPDASAASITFGASTNVGDPAASLWVNTPILSAQAQGGVWINDAATAPVSVPLIVAINGPVVLGGQGDLALGSVYTNGPATLTSATGAVLDGMAGGANAETPNIIAASVTVTAATNGGSASDALWVNSPTITAAATSGGVWINDAATTPVTLSSATTNDGPIVIGSQGELSVIAVNAGSGSATLNSATGSVIDGIEGGSNAGTPNVIAGAVTVNAGSSAGNPSDPLWVNAASISGSATTGGVWINDASSTPVTVASVTTGGGPVVIGGQGDLAIGSINAGSGSATLTSTTGGVLDGTTGGSNVGNPNITAGAVTISAATSEGSASDALWVNSPTITASAANGGVWINDASTAPVTVSSVTSSGGPIVVGSQGDLSVVAVNAGSSSATLNSATGSVVDGILSGSNAATPNVIAAAVTVNAAVDAGNPSDPLWVNAASISGSATTGGVWINDAATTPVTVASLTTGNGPVVIGAQGDLLIDSINAGSGSAMLTSATGAVLDGVTGGSNAGNPNVTAGAITVNSALATGNASDALWVNASTITAAAAGGGVWINDASATPATVASVTTSSGPVVIGSQGNLLIDSVNAGSGTATLASSTGSVLDGLTGGSNAGNPNVIASAVTVNSANDGGSPSDALWVNAASISGSATTGGVWINDAATTPVTVASVTSNGGSIVIGSQGELSVVSVNAGNGSATLNSATGAVVDGINGGSNAGTPNVTAGSVTVNSATNGGSPTDALWVNAASISGTATDGGVWINDAATTPVTVASITTQGGPVVIGGQGNLLIGSINAASGTATLTSVAGGVLDGATGGSNAGSPNVTASAVTVDSASSGAAGNALWVNSPTITASATNGGVWINDASTATVTVSSVTANGGPVVIGSQGNLSVVAVNAGSGSATLNSAAGSVVDGIDGGSNVGNPNVTAGSVTVNSASNGGSPTDALWVNAASISGSATTGGVWINDAATTPVTVGSVITGGGPVVLGGQGDLLIGSINAGSGSATLTSVTGGVLDGTTGGSNAGNPNITASAVTVDSATNGGASGNALWVNAASITAAAATGGVWINDAATTPVTVASVTTNGEPIVIGSQGNLSVVAVNAGSGSATLNSAAGSVVDGIAGGSNSATPNVTAGSVTVNSAVNGGNSADALWVNAASISGSATTGGVWINDAATTPVTVASVTTRGGPVVIGGAGTLLIDSINAGSGSAMLTSSTGAVLDGVTGGSSATNPNVTAGAVTVNSATDGGASGNALWVNAATITAAATTGGIWINDAATAPVTVASVTTDGEPIVIGSQGNLSVVAVNAGSGSATLYSTAGSVIDGIPGSASASHPDITAASVTVNSGTNGGSPTDALWVDAASISGSATTGGVWINDAATTPVTVASVTTNGGPVVIGGHGSLLIDSINAGSGSATLSSLSGSVLDGISGGSSAAHPNVTATSVTVDSATSGGMATDALWVNAGTISADSLDGGVWINDASSSPVRLLSVTALPGPIVINSNGNLVVNMVNGGTGDVTLGSNTGSILDGTSGRSNDKKPNITGGTVTLNAPAGTVGTYYDRVYINSAATLTTASAEYLNDPPTPYPALPLLVGVSPVTVYQADAFAQIQAPQQLPVTLIGQPLRAAPPMAVSVETLGILLPQGVDADAVQQDNTMGTASTPIMGGNDEEIGRERAAARAKKKARQGSETTRNLVKKTKLEG